MRQVLAPCAVGGLRDTVAPGDVVVPDQLVDRTHRRVSSYVETGACHLPFADPYCAAIGAAVTAADPSIKSGGTMVVIEGPRFSTRAESQHYAAQGWDLINMTGAPEAALAREMRQCYAAIALVTDMDAGAESGEGVGQEQVFALFRANLERLTGLLTATIAGLPDPDRLLLLDLGGRDRADLRGAAARRSEVRSRPRGSRSGRTQPVPSRRVPRFTGSRGRRAPHRRAAQLLTATSDRPVRRSCDTSRSCSSTRSRRSRRAPTWWPGAGSGRRTRRATCATPSTSSR